MAERAENHPQGLREAVNESLEQVLSKNSSLAKLVKETLRNGNSEEMPVVLAALDVIAQFNETASELVHVQGAAIFGGDASSESVQESSGKPKQRRGGVEGLREKLRRIRKLKRVLSSVKEGDSSAC